MGLAVLVPCTPCLLFAIRGGLIERGGCGEWETGLGGAGVRGVFCSLGSAVEWLGCWSGFANVYGRGRAR